MKMINKPYTYITEFYNHLMKDIDYEGWADYIVEIYNDLQIKSELTLEIASGNCKLSAFLKNRIGDVILTDISDVMLSFHGTGLKRVCCDMKSLPFNKKFDFIFSTFDSVNYLLTEKDLLIFFYEIKRLLTSEGFFTFDVSLEQNSLRYEKSLNRKGVFKSLKYVQKSKYDRIRKIHHNVFKIHMKNGKIVEEIHLQKIFDFNTYFQVADKAGLVVKRCFDAFSFEDANLNNERVQFIIKRR